MVFTFDGEVAEDTVIDTVYVSPVVGPSGTGTLTVIALVVEVPDDVSFI